MLIIRIECRNKANMCEDIFEFDAGNVEAHLNDEMIFAIRMTVFTGGTVTIRSVTVN